jgi:hypothetical protein
MRGEQVSIHEVEKRWTRVFATVREIALGSIAQLTDSITYYAPQDREEVCQIVEAAIYGMLDEIASDDPKVWKHDGVEHDRGGPRVCV